MNITLNISARKLWFTADQHFGHNNIIKHCSRPFASTAEMDQKLIDNWNAVVQDEDVVFFLGDFAWRGSEIDQYLTNLCGKIYLVVGNHDHSTTRKHKRFVAVADLINLSLPLQNATNITMCHYAMRTWHCSHHGSWHLHGHSHGLLPSQGRSMDVGVDCNGFAPVSFDSIKRTLEAR